MLERFYSLRTCIDKAPIDYGSTTKFSANEWALISDLINCLQPVKLAVEALCRIESTLITADTTLKFALNKLKIHGTILSEDLPEALKRRIGERRLTDVTGMLIYLQNSIKYDLELKKKTSDTSGNEADPEAGQEGEGADKTKEDNVMIQILMIPCVRPGMLVWKKSQSSN